MYCEKCKTQIPDGRLMCPYCRHKFAYEAQKKKVELAQDQSRVILEKSVHSGFFICAAIVMTLLSIFQFVIFVSQLFNDIAVASSMILPSIFSIIATVYFWIAVASKNSHNLHNHFTKLSIYEAYQKVSLIIETIFAGILSVIIVIALLSFTYSTKEVFTEPEAQDIIQSVSVTIFIALIVFMTFMIWSASFSRKEEDISWH